MKANNNFFKIFITIIIILCIPIIYDYISWLINWIDNNEERLKNDITIFGSIISILLFIKIRFFDTRLFNKIEKEYGKQKLYDSLVVLNELLKFFTIEEVIQKINLISNTEINMKNAIMKIRDIIEVDESTGDVCFYLNSKEKKELSTKIKQLLDAINKNVEIQYLGRKITTNSKKSEFESNLEKAAYSAKQNIKMEKITKKKGKSKIWKWTSGD